MVYNGFAAVERVEGGIGACVSLRASARQALRKVLDVGRRIRSEAIVVGNFALE